MKTTFKLGALTLLLSTINAQLAQGSLTPPAGAPAPAMKSREQIKPHTTDPRANLAY